MIFSKAQKKYLKKNLRSSSLAEIAGRLNVPQEEIINFLQTRWPKEKYQKLLLLLSFLKDSRLNLCR